MAGERAGGELANDLASARCNEKGIMPSPLFLHLRQNEPNVEPSTMTATSAIMQLTITVITMSR